MQRTHWAIACLALVLASTSCALPPAVQNIGGDSVRISATTAAALPDFNLNRAMGHIRQLSNEIGVRLRGRNGEFRAARYISAQFRALGFHVQIQKFQVDGGRTSRNVIAWAASVAPDPFVIGAHMDTVHGSPGANDNGSGIAVLLETARMVASTSKANLLKFVAFGSEEYGTDGRHHVGSQVMVRRTRRARREAMPGMLSVDMVADGKPLLIGTSGIGPRVVSRMIYRKVRDARIAASYRTLCDCSDNGPFERAGIPAAFMWSDLEPDYHSPSDVPANLNRTHVLRSGRAVRAFVSGLTQAWLNRFRQY